MTKHSLSILVLIFLASCGMDSNQLVVKNESGQITAKYSIDKDSVRNGSFETYYEDGQIRESGQYKNGQLDGLKPNTEFSNEQGAPEQAGDGWPS